MMNKVVRCIYAFCCAAALAAPIAQAQSPAGAPLKIMHVMSFDSPWRWTDGQLAGFKEGLGVDVRADYRVFQMDVKKNNTPEAKETKGQEARAIIDEWKPDLLYVSDDDAMSFVAKHYANSKMAIVFSGVNRTTADHGLEGARNVTGVLEREHFVESVKLVQAIDPKVKRIVVLTDESPQFAPVIERIRARMAELPGVTLVGVDTVKTFDEFQKTVQAYPGKADAIVQLGVFTLKDDKGQPVPYQTVQRWMAENSKLPEISFWIDRIFYGVLAAVTVSEKEQGLAAGKLARAILIDQKAPSSLAIAPTVKGNPSISLSRSKVLGINVKSSLLLSSEVVTQFEWNKK